VCANYPLIIKVNKTSGQLTFGPVQPQVGGGGEVLPYMAYMGMCSPDGYGFTAVLAINRV